MWPEATMTWWAVALMFLVAMAANAQPSLVNLFNDSYTVAYDVSLNCPREVRWQICSSQLKPNVKRSNIKFRVDTRLPRPRASASDFTRTGYQRGHMCPAADRVANLRLMRETFLMSNVCPQAPRLNMGEWKSTEVYARQLSRSFGACSVAVAPIFLPEDTNYIGKHKLAVPHAFFKVVWVAGKPATIRMWFLLNQ